jgi:hypothetical protein
MSFDITDSLCVLNGPVFPVYPSGGNFLYPFSGYDPGKLPREHWGSMILNSGIFHPCYLLRLKKTPSPP